MYNKWRHRIVLTLHGIFEPRITQIRSIIRHMLTEWSVWFPLEAMFARFPYPIGLINYEVDSVWNSTITMFDILCQQNMSGIVLKTYLILSCIISNTYTIIVKILLALIDLKLNLKYNFVCPTILYMNLRKVNCINR